MTAKPAIEGFLVSLLQHLRAWIGSTDDLTLTTQPRVVAFLEGLRGGSPSAHSSHQRRSEVPGISVVIYSAAGRNLGVHLDT